jgi:hypothetical protein
MTNYTKTTNFATKDTLPSGNANKIVKGTEIDTEFNNIATAVATKADTAGPTFTGTVTIPTVDLNGGAIDGTTVGASTAAAITGTTIVANTSINIAGDGATVTGIKDEDDMSSNSATKLATQQSIKAYVDSQVTAQDLDFQADSGGALSIDLDSETLTFTGGTGVDTSGSGNAVTFAIDSTVATLAGTQTLTNKTLTSPTLNTPTIGTSFTIGSATITEAELEILDGATVTTAELNVLDGITSTTAELNILDGVTSTAAELNILDGVTSTAAELNILDGVTSTAAELNILDGVTSTTAELNILDGVTSTTAELNILDGVTATTAELNYVDGVTSAIQTQLDAKAPLASPTFTGTVNAAAMTVDTTTLVVDATNNRVGIGDSSPSNTLTITNGSSGATEANGAIVPLMIENSSSAYINFLTPNNANAGFLFSDPEGNNVGQMQYLHGSNALVFATGASEAMRILSNQRVSIGGTSSNHLLNVTSSTTPALEFTRGSGNATIGIDNGNSIAVGGTAGDLVLRASGTTGVTKFTDSGGNITMTLTEANNVGIGTSSPTDTLNISSNTNQIGLDTGDQATYGTLDVGHFANGAFIGTQAGSNAASNLLRFGTSGTERMRIDSSGNLLVGTTNASGSGASSGKQVIQFAGAGVNGLYLDDTRTSSGTDNAIIFGRGATYCGKIETTTAPATNYVSASDQRLKENIADADDAGSKIDAIQVRKYDWIGDGTHQEYGLVAQELQPIAPLAVSGDADSEDMMGVDYSKLVPMLIKEIQSLRARVQQLENN